MAASDPTTGVPTPTGTLQGLATFSWDGANWQPSGRATSSVATPTGVLRGVAPFNWDGAAWQPSGKAMPSVATPSGVLDGVAVYTWSGSAWTPTGGAPDVPTPSGTLQGVAAFSWDGTAWQPSGQAAAEVPTPYGVLQGAALFAWNGNAWAQAAPGATLDINFLNTTALDARVAFTRGSVGTYFDANGILQTVSGNAPRFDNDPVSHASRGLLIEEPRSNLLYPSVPNLAAWAPLGPATLAGSIPAPDGTTATTSLVSATDTTNNVRAVNPNAASVTTGSTAYVVSGYMKAGPVANGFIQVNTPGPAAGVAYFDLTNGIAVVGADLSAGLTAKSASITPIGGGWYRVSYAFTTPAAGTSIAAYFGPCTVVSGTGDNRSTVGVVGQGVYVWGAQIENGAYPTSYIPTTSAIVTRNIETATVPTGSWFNTAGIGSIAEDYSISSPPSSNRMLYDFWDGTHNNEVLSFLQATDATSQVTVGGALRYNQAPSVTVTPGATHKHAFSWSATTGTIYQDGSQLNSSATTGAGPTTITQAVIGNYGGGGGGLDGYIRRFRYWPRVLSNTEMQQVTT